jgi:flagellar biosynthesis protein FliR
MIALVLALRGAVAIAVLTTLAGGIPRIAQAGLAVTIGLWSAAMVLPSTQGASIVVAIHEVVIGASLGVMAAIPLLAAHSAGRLVDLAATRRAHGPYGLLFGVLAAAVFVGINGHVAVMVAIVDSHRTMPSLGATEAGVLAALAALVPSAIRLAVPWLVTAAVVEIAIGAGVRLANRSGAHAPTAAAVPAALVMMTASLVATLAIAMAAMMRGAL